MARTQITVIVEKDPEGHVLCIYCNDPNAVLKNQPYPTVTECGCCGAYHRKGFDGDCRDDDERFYPLD